MKMTPADDQQHPFHIKDLFSPVSLVFWLFLSIYIFSITLVPIRSDNDCWWHVKSGMYIAENGLPEHDVFSYTAEDYEWHNHEWLAQILFYKAWQIGDSSGFGGWRGVILFKAIIVWLAYSLLFFLVLAISRNAYLALLIAVLAVAIGRRTFYPRPPVISNLFLMGEIWLLIAVSEGWIRKGWVFLLVPVIALWTNLHGAWMAGGVLVGAFAIEQAASHIRRFPLENYVGHPPVQLSWKELGLFLVLCLAATFANPYGIELYKLPGRVMSDLELVRSIGELRSPDFFFVIDFELSVLALIAVTLFSRGFKARLFEVLIALFFLHQAIQHVRHLLLFSVMMAPLYARVGGYLLERLNRDLAKSFTQFRIAGNTAVLFLAALCACWVLVNPREGGSLSNVLNLNVSASTYPQRNLQYFSGDGYIKERFPSRAVDVIELAELQGRMFNENSYAGYLIWRLSPEDVKVFTDPRFDIFGGDIWRKERLIAEGRTETFVDENGNRVSISWETLLNEYDVQWALIPAGIGLAYRFSQNTDEWVLAADWSHIPRQEWQIWIRNIPENEPQIKSVQSVAGMAGATFQESGE